MLERNAGVFSEGHQVGQEEAIRDWILSRSFFADLASFATAGDALRRGRGMFRPPSSPAAAHSPAVPVTLGTHAVVKKEQRGSPRACSGRHCGENPGRADEASGPVATAFGFTRVEQNEVSAGIRVGRDRDSVA